MDYAFVNITINYAFVTVNSWPQQVLKYLSRHAYCLIYVSLPCVVQLSTASDNETSLRSEVSVRNL